MKKYDFITKNFLKEEYIKNKRNINQIAKKIGCSIIPIRDRLKKFNIKIRTVSEAKMKEKIKMKCGICNKKFEIHPYRIKISKNFYCSNECRNKSRSMEFAKLRGSNHWNWQGGISLLNELIRRLPEYKNWRNIVFERDNYTCQKCEQYGGNLEVHHKKSFTELYNEFLKEYDQFSPVEDKETLVRLAMKWKPFWEITNGKTLCEDCHKNTKKKLLWRKK